MDADIPIACESGFTPVTSFFSGKIKDKKKPYLLNWPLCAAVGVFAWLGLTAARALQFWPESPEHRPLFAGHKQASADFFPEPYARRKKKKQNKKTSAGNVFAFKMFSYAEKQQKKI